MKNIIVVLFALAAVAPALIAQSATQPPSRNEIGIEERLGAQIPLDLELYNERGYLTPLKEIINKPTIVTFVYYRCPGICSPLLTEVAHVVDNLGLKLGTEYQILTVSFNHRETPDLALEKKANYLSQLHTKVDENGWHWMTGDSLTLQKLTSAAGFYFKPDGDDFVHAGALIVLSPEGKITRYLLGVEQIPFDVKLAISEAWQGKSGPTIAKVLDFCYSYDPDARSYTFNVTRIAGVIVLALAGIFVLVFLVLPKKTRREA